MDSISNLITKIRNATKAEKESVSFPYSKFHMAIAEALVKEGYIESVSKKGKRVPKFIEIKLNKEEEKRIIQGIKRVSTQSQRIYRGVSKIRSVRSGMGRLILSTSKGIMTDREAKKEKVGGEALFEIW